MQTRNDQNQEAEGNKGVIEKLEDYTGLAVIFFGKSELHDKDHLYRGSGKTPSEIFEEGFVPRGISADLHDHVNPPNAKYSIDSGYISTTTSKETALKFPMTGKYRTTFLYVINPLKNTIDVTKELPKYLAEGKMGEGMFDHLIKENERAIFGGIKSSDIKGVWKVKKVMKVMNEETFISSRHIEEGSFIANPDYVAPPSTKLEKSWTAGRYLSHTLTGVGVLIDGLHLTQEYKKGKQSGDYGSFFRESTGVLHGWMGAFAVGGLFAAEGAIACLPIVPIAAPICGAVGGAAGSFLGYLGSKEIAMRNYDARRAEHESATSSHTKAASSYVKPVIYNPNDFSTPIDGSKTAWDLILENTPKDFCVPQYDSEKMTDNFETKTKKHSTSAGKGKTKSTAQSEVSSRSATYVLALLDEDLDEMQISDPKERALYLQSLSKALGRKIGLSPDDKTLLNERDEFIEDLLESEEGLKQELLDVNYALQDIGKEATRVNTKTIRNQISQQQAAVKFQMMSDSFSILHSLGQLTGNRNLQKVAAFGQASTQIVSTMSSLNTAIAGGALTAATAVGAVAGIAAAACVIMQLFGDEEDQSENFQIILEQMQALSKQMEQFRHEVLEQFMYVQHGQRLIYEAVYQGFNLIAYLVKTGTEDLRISVISRLADIQSHLSLLEKQIGDGFKDLELQPLLEAIYFIETDYQRYESSGAITISSENYHQLMRKLSFWLISRGSVTAQSKKPQLTGTALLPAGSAPLQQHHYRHFITLLNNGTSQSGQTLGFLLSYARSYLLKDADSISALKSLKSPINIEIWSFVVDAYIKLRTLGSSKNIGSNEDTNDLTLILQDADDLLNMFATMQNLRTPIFAELIKKYNNEIDHLKLQLNEAVSSILDEKLVGLGNDATQLPLKETTVNFHGAEISLNDHRVHNIAIPAVFRLAQECGFGRFGFDTTRSKRYEGSGPDHGTGVDTIVYPTVTYIVDVYFEINQTHRTPIVSGEKHIHKYAWFSLNNGGPGYEVRAFQAKADYEGTSFEYQWNTRSKVWIQEPSQVLFKKRWSELGELTFERNQFTIDEESITQSLKVHVLKQNIGTIIKRDTVQDCILKLNFYHALIHAYIKMIGNSGDKFFTSLLAIKSGAEINVLLLNHALNSPENILSTSLDNLYEKLLPPIQMLTQAENEKTEFVQSPLAYPVLERMIKLSPLFINQPKPVQNASEDKQEDKNQYENKRENKDKDQGGDKHDQINEEWLRVIHEEHEEDKDCLYNPSLSEKANRDLPSSQADAARIVLLNNRLIHCGEVREEPFESDILEESLIPEPGYQSSLNEQLNLFQWGLHYLGKHLHDWMPSNQEREITSTEILDLMHWKNELSIRNEKLEDFKEGKIAACGLFQDKLEWLDKKIPALISKISKVIRLRKLTDATLHGIDQLSSRILSYTDAMADHSKLLKEWTKKAKELTKENKYIQVHYNLLENDLTMQVKEKAPDQPLAQPPQPVEPHRNSFVNMQQFWNTVSGTSNTQPSLAREIRRELCK